MSSRGTHRCGRRPCSSLIGRLTENDFAKSVSLGGRQKIWDLMTTRVSPGEIKSPARCALRTVDGQRWEGICLDKTLQSRGSAQTSQNCAGYRSRIRKSQAPVGGTAENNLFVEARLR